MYSTENYRKSFEWLARAGPLIPEQTQTLSKGPNVFVRGACPVYLSHGKNGHVWDVDGNEYVDFALSLGPVILGYRYPAVDRAIRAQLAQGISFSLPHPLEVEVSEAIVDAVPCAQMVRFGKNGADGTAAAVRVARAYTGRQKVAYCGYHGYQDWYIITQTARNDGIPPILQEYMVPFQYNDIASLQKAFDIHKGQIAAVIMEPVSTDEPRDNFLQQVRRLCDENGAVLIFDETVTGFRMDLGGAQKYYGVTPDLGTFGKAVSNGMPLSVLAGKSEIMKVFERLFYSTTFGGETLSLAAAQATIGVMKSRPVFPRLWRLGNRFLQGVRRIVKKHGLEEAMDVKGVGVHSVFVFKPARGLDKMDLKSLFLQESIARGILGNGANNICFTHTGGDIAKALDVYDETFGMLRAAIDAGDVHGRLRGQTAREVFRRY